MKMRVNQGQKLVIGGYTPSLKNFDALVVGYYDGPNLIYAARTRNGFTPASRAQLFRKLKPLETDECPFANLAEKKTRRCGAGLAAAKMVGCWWVLCRMRHSAATMPSVPDYAACDRVLAAR
jgi:ATP-dependent DNA ligase